MLCELGSCLFLFSMSKTKPDNVDVVGEICVSRILDHAGMCGARVVEKLKQHVENSRIPCGMLGLCAEFWHEIKTPTNERYVGWLKMVLRVVVVRLTTT
jgi:hypothetical protein